MYKIAVMGDGNAILGFSAIGIDAVPISDAEQAQKELKRLASQQYAVIYITEDVAVKIRDDIKKYDRSLTPAIILIPGAKGSLGIGISNISDSVERAVGADILGN